jgi:hypothetical protein
MSCSPVQLKKKNSLRQKKKEKKQRPGIKPSTSHLERASLARRPSKVGDHNAPVIVIFIKGKYEKITLN